MKKRMRILGIILGTVLTTAMSGFVAGAASAQMTGAYETYMEDGVSEEAQEAFAAAMENYEGEELTPVQLLESQLVAGMNYRILCTGAYGSKVIVTVYKDLNGNCEVTNEQKVISVLDQSRAMEEAADFSADVEFDAEDFDFEANTLTFGIYMTALYDMVDMSRMEVGDIVEVNGTYITVDTKEDGSTIRRSEDGEEEKVATICINKDTAEEQMFIANEGGTWIAKMENDYLCQVKVGEKTLPLAENLAFTDCTSNPGESVEVSFEELPGYMDAQKDSFMAHYSPLNTKIEVENGEICSIVRTWMP